MRSASDPTLEGLSDGAVKAEWLFAGLVILGVLGEFVIAARHPPYGSPLEHWGPAFADFLIAVGVAGEVGASMIAHICQSDLTRRSNDRLGEMELAAGFAHEKAAMAAERAAQAELSLLEYRAQRGLSEEGQQEVAAALAQYAGTPFDAALTRGDAECNRCSKTIESALRSAGLVQIDWAGQGDAIPARGERAEVGEVMGIGLFLTVEGETHPELVPIAEAIAAALARAGVEAVAFAKVNAPNANTHAIHLHVCQKP